MKIDSGSRSAPLPAAPASAHAPAHAPAVATGHDCVAAPASANTVNGPAPTGPVHLSGAGGGAPGAGSLEWPRSHVLAHERSHGHSSDSTGGSPPPSVGASSPPFPPSTTGAGGGGSSAAGDPSALLPPPAPSPSSPSPSPDPSSPSPPPPGGAIVVRAEEALIVILVLVLWVAAIALFFNRWGKIRMLEPYQPKYEAPHRGSCPLVDCAGAPTLQFNLSGCALGAKEAGLCSSMPSPHNLLRPRQNSVFVGSSATMVTLPLNPPRKAKSAMDIQTLVLAECGPLPVGGSGANSFDIPDGPHVPDHLPDSNFSAALAKVDTFKVTNV